MSKGKSLKLSSKRNPLRTCVSSGYPMLTGKFRAPHPITIRSRDEDYIRVEKKDKRKQHKNRLFCYIWQVITIVFVRWSQSAFTLYHYGLASSALLALFPEGVARLFPTPLFRQVMAVLQAVLLVVLGNMSTLLVVVYVGGAWQHVKFVFSLWCCSTIYLSGIYFPLVLRCSESL